jgi:hypothetical protein
VLAVRKRILFLSALWRPQCAWKMASVFTWHNILLPCWNRNPPPALTSTNTKLSAQNILTDLPMICGTNSDHFRKGSCCFFCNDATVKWDWTFLELCCYRLNSCDTWCCVCRWGVLYVWQDDGAVIMVKQSKFYPKDGRIRFLETWGTIQPLKLCHIPRFTVFCFLRTDVYVFVPV